MSSSIGVDADDADRLAEPRPLREPVRRDLLAEGRLGAGRDDAGSPQLVGDGAEQHEADHDQRQAEAPARPLPGAQAQPLHSSPHAHAVLRTRGRRFFRVATKESLSRAERALGLPESRWMHVGRPAPLPGMGGAGRRAGLRTGPRTGRRPAELGPGRAGPRRARPRARPGPAGLRQDPPRRPREHDRELPAGPGGIPAEARRGRRGAVRELDGRHGHVGAGRGRPRGVRGLVLANAALPPKGSSFVGVPPSVSAGFLLTGTRRLGPALLQRRMNRLGAERMVWATLEYCTAHPESLDPAWVAATIESFQAWVEWPGASGVFSEASRSIVRAYTFARAYRRRLAGDPHARAADPRGGPTGWCRSRTPGTRRASTPTGTWWCFRTRGTSRRSSARTGSWPRRGRGWTGFLLEAARAARLNYIVVIRSGTLLRVGGHPGRFGRGQGAQPAARRRRAVRGRRSGRRSGWSACSPLAEIALGVTAILRPTPAVAFAVGGAYVLLRRRRVAVPVEPARPFVRVPG